MLTSIHRAAALRKYCKQQRNLFNLFGKTAQTAPEPIKYHERKILPYSQKQIYDIVSDVASYKDFVPYCLASTAQKKRGDVGRDHIMHAEITVGMMPVRVSYACVVRCRPYEFVEARAAPHSQTFDYLKTIWTFQPASPHSPHPSNPDTPPSSRHPPNGRPTLVSYDLSYTLKDPTATKLLGAVFSSLAADVLEAFEARCRSKYGPGAL